MIWLNGELLDESTARVPALDRALLAGEGVFETLRAWRGQPFALTRHYRRLTEGAARFGIDPPSVGTLREALEAVARPDAERLRVTLTASGSAIVSAAPLPGYGASAKVVVSKYVVNERSPLAGVKCTSYAANLLALAEARSAGADEALMANTVGNLCEGTTSNVFGVRDGKAVTPPLASGCLPGVTRALVIELCGKHGIPCEERDIPMDALAAFDELFLTSSLRDIQPVGSGATPVASALRGHFDQWRSADIDP